MDASADAGARVSVDAGVSSACECVTDVRWKEVRVEVPGPVRYVRNPDAGAPVEIHTVETVPILVPDLHLSGHTDAMAALDSVGTAQGGASAHVAPPEPGVSLVWGAGVGAQHDDALRFTVGGQAGLGFGRSSVTVAGGVAPTASSHWNLLVLYGGRLP